MPKFDATHTVERLQKRLVELESGVEVANRDIRALLTDEQCAAMDAALAEQEVLRKNKRARTKEEQQALGWLSKRDVRIRTVQQAIAQAEYDELDALLNKQRSLELRQTRKYFDALTQAEAAGKDKQTAKNWANNELTRAGLPRMDGQQVDSLNARDAAVWAMEAELRARFKKKMTAAELEQLAMSEEYERAQKNGVKRRQ